MLGEQELLRMAQYIYNSQLEQIGSALRQVLGRTKLAANKKVPALVTGIGKESVARKAAEKAGFCEIVDLEDLIHNVEATKASPAFGVALLVAEKLEGRAFQWTQLSK